MMHLRLLSLGLLCGVLSGVFSSPAPGVDFDDRPVLKPFAQTIAKRVILAVIDGPRRTETWDEPTRQYIPKQAKELAPQGTLYVDFRNSGFTYTNSGHGALVNGFYQQIENGGHEMLARPGLFQRFLRATGKGPEAAWLITSKDKLFILGDCSDPEWQGKWNPTLDCGKPGRGPLGGYRDDRVTLSRVLTVLQTAPPDLMLINFKDPDAMGHGKNWPGYLQAIRDTDVYVSTLWALIQTDPRLKDSTALLITNDHGRHDEGHADGYISHGDDCAGCRKISLLALGPDFAKGRVVTDQRNLTDLAVTVARMIGVELTGSQGKVMDELFVPPLPPQRPAP